MNEHAHEKPVIPFSVWGGIALLLVGVVVGTYLAPALEPWINPERAALLQNTQTTVAQNALLKNQVDCLTEGIMQNHGKAALTDCT
jgi:hypothetical protein